MNHCPALRFECWHKSRKLPPLVGQICFVLHDVFVSLRSDRYQSDHERSKPLRWEKSVSSSQQLVIFSFLLTRLTRLTRLTLLVPVVQW